MKYRIKCNNSWWLFFTLFAFLNMGGTVTWIIQQKKHWLSKWKTIERYDNKVDAYIKYFKLAYNLNVKKTLRLPHNKEKGKKVWCELTFQYVDAYNECANKAKNEFIKAISKTPIKKTTTQYKYEEDRYNVKE